MFIRSIEKNINRNNDDFIMYKKVIGNNLVLCILQNNCYSMNKFCLEQECKIHTEYHNSVCTCRKLMGIKSMWDFTQNPI